MCYALLTLDVSVFIALYSLTIFWMCLRSELKPFHVAGKFMCVKGVIFFSFWQGLTISILVAVGIIRHSAYTQTQATDFQLAPFEMIFISLPLYRMRSSAWRCLFSRWGMPMRSHISILSSLLINSLGVCHSCMRCATALRLVTSFRTPFQHSEEQAILIKQLSPTTPRFINRVR